MANTFDKLGRVHRDAGRYAQAEGYFKKDLARAKSFQDCYQETEAHYGLSILYLQWGKPTLMRSETTQVRLLAARHEYPYFAARAWELQGDAWLQNEKYTRAFQDYAKACMEMLKYTGLRYEELATRTLKHFDPLSIHVKKRIYRLLADWADECSLESRERELGSRIHLLEMISRALE